MAAHLWVDAPPPPEYVILYLCRDVYHCTPSELAKQDPKVVLGHLTCIKWEAEIKERETK